MGHFLNPDQVIPVITRFLQDQLERSGLTGFIVGLSGGIDSAVSAGLAVRAVGPGKVFGLLMPYRTSSENSVTDALSLVDKLGIEHRKVDISPMVDAYFQDQRTSTALRLGNKMARERMSILFDIAATMNRLVLGTGNRTEFCLGYTTLFGDSACSLNPVGELYKTEIRNLAERLEIPEPICRKVPSADLWADQTDEGEIGVTYDVIDRLLVMILEEGVTSESQLQKEGFQVSDIRRVVSLLNQNYFKRRLPAVASLERAAVPEKIELGR